MPITDNNSHHPFGLFWQNGVHVCCLLPLRDRWRETTEIQIPGMLQVLWEEQNRAAGNFSIFQVVSATPTAAPLFSAAQRQ